MFKFLSSDNIEFTDKTGRAFSVEPDSDVMKFTDENGTMFYVRFREDGTLWGMRFEMNSSCIGDYEILEINGKNIKTGEEHRTD